MAIKYLQRYRDGERMNHWLIALLFFAAGLSGLAFFHPSLFFLTGLFGGGQLTRAIHPWIGVVLFFSFAGLFLRFWKANLWVREDGTWMAKLRDVIAGHDENLPEVGKYNAGQKMVFWSMSFLIIVLISSGLVIWERYFGGLFSLTQQRIAMLVQVDLPDGSLALVNTQEHNSRALGLYERLGFVRQREGLLVLRWDRPA